VFDMTNSTDVAVRSTFGNEPSLLSVLRSPKSFVRESLAGAVTALALIPEVISFSFISGIDPKAALVASIVLGLFMSVLGGRPAMVTAAAGSVALVVGPMVKAHGVDYILPTMLLAGVVQIVFGLAGLARIMRFIPRSVMIGFVDALAILIFAAQVPHILHVRLIVYPLFLLTMAIMLVLPKITTAIPAALVAIVVVTAIAIGGGLVVPNVGGEGAMPPGLPGMTPLTVPLDLTTLRIIWPTALSVAFVGLLETQLTDTRSHKGKESWALGIANIAAGFYGGIGGCAMIGQTVVNVKIGGGRTRVSTTCAALVLLLLVTILSSLMARIPMAALSAVMMIVAIKTFNWHSVSIATLRRMPIPETLVLATTVVVTVATGNLALGIAAGVLLAMVLFARRVAHVIRVDRVASHDGASVRYDVRGPLFFGSSHDLVERFCYGADPANIEIDLTHSQIWDASSVAALDSIETKYRDRGARVRISGLDERSTNFHARLSKRL
jgi:sulfate permease, SulP family